MPPKTKPKNKGGRPSKYTPEIVEKARDYLENYNKTYDHAIPSIIGMAMILNVHKSTLYDWASKEGNEFSDILELCVDFQQFRLIDGSLKGELNSHISKLVLGKHGYSEKTQQDVNINNYTELDDDELSRRLAEVRQQKEQAEKMH